MKAAVVPDPIAGTPMVVPMGRHHWDGTTRWETHGHAESYAHPSGMPTPRW
jgi:hypothetical protein